MSSVNNDRLVSSFPAAMTFFFVWPGCGTILIQRWGVGLFSLFLTLAGAFQHLTIGYEISFSRLWKFPSIFGFLTFRKILSKCINWDTLQLKTFVKTYIIKRVKNKPQKGAYIYNTHIWQKDYRKRQVIQLKWAKTTSKNFQWPNKIFLKALDYTQEKDKYLWVLTDINKWINKNRRDFK